MSQKIKPEGADLGRFGDVIASLERIARMRKLGAERDPETIRTAVTFLRKYVEPWQCPDCRWIDKVPADDAYPRNCPECGGGRVISRSYLEQERMADQLKMLYETVLMYGQKPGMNPDLANETIKRCANWSSKVDDWTKEKIRSRVFETMLSDGADGFISADSQIMEFVWHEVLGRE